MGQETVRVVCIDSILDKNSVYCPRFKEVLKRDLSAQGVDVDVEHFHFHVLKGEESKDSGNGSVWASDYIFWESSILGGSYDYGERFKGEEGMRRKLEANAELYARIYERIGRLDSHCNPLLDSESSAPETPRLVVTHSRRLGAVEKAYKNLGFEVVRLNGKV